MQDESTIRILRNQAWERAKGELYAMLSAFHGTNFSGRPLGANEGQFEALHKAVTEFILHVERDGLSE